MVQCPRSKEKVCRQRAASVSCDAATASQVAAAPRPTTRRARQLDWRAVVFGIATFDSAAERALLQAAAETWLTMVRGADLLVTTDGDDPRPDAEVAPVAPPGVAVHVHRCAECRGVRCDRASRADGVCEGGVREGWLARRKVLEMLREMFERFVRRRRRRGATGDAVNGSSGAGAGAGGGGGGGGGASSASAGGGGGAGGGGKRFFLKLDADAVVLPHTLLPLARELHGLLGPTERWLLGMAACRVTSFALCHAAGGAGYALSRAALRTLHGYARRGFPPYGGVEKFLERVDRFTYGGEDVTVAFALKKAAGVAVINCGSFYQHEPLKYERLHAKGEEWVRWPLSATPLTFHKFKSADALRAFFRCSLYDASGQPRAYPRALLARVYNESAAVGDCDDPWVAGAAPAVEP